MLPCRSLFSRIQLPLSKAWSFHPDGPPDPLIDSLLLKLCSQSVVVEAMAVRTVVRGHDVLCVVLPERECFGSKTRNEMKWRPPLGSRRRDAPAGSLIPISLSVETKKEKNKNEKKIVLLQAIIAAATIMFHLL